MSCARTTWTLALAGCLAACAANSPSGSLASAGQALSSGPITLVQAIEPGGSSNPGSFTTVGGMVFFTATTAAAGTELWKTDGTPAGTTMVMDINPGTGSSTPQLLTAFGSKLAFVADDGVNGPGVWVSDGTAAGTLRVANTALPAQLAVAGGSLLFAGPASANGRELWVSGGTPGSAVELKDINPGAASSNIQDMTVFGNAVYFSADDGVHGAELWRSDGTASGTVLVDDINPNGDSSPSQLTVAGNALYFVAKDGVHNNEPWMTDGTTTQLVKDINPGGASSSPSQLTAVGDTLYFAASDGTHGPELWTATGTTAQLVKDIYPGAGGSNPSGLTADHSSLYFAANDGTHGLELWKSDGTAAGTLLVKDINPGPGDGLSASAAPLALPQGELLFPANDGTAGVELWKSDGSALGTTLVQDLDPAAASSNPAGWGQIGGLVLFSATDGSSGQQLWSVPVSAVAVPTIACPASVDAQATGASGATVTYSPAFATDAAGTPAVTYSQASGTTFPLGETTVTATATDSAGTSVECSFIVTVVNAPPLSISCPPEATVAATSSAGVVVNSYPAVNVTDPAGTTTVSYNPPAGTLLPVGTSLIVTTATDDQGNSAQCSFAINVTAPIRVVCPGDQTAEATSSSGAAVTFPEAVAKDPNSVPTITYSQAPGTTFPLGSTMVTATATDDLGYSATCFFTVTVKDTTAPALTCPDTVIAEATSPAGAAVTFPAPVVTDAVTASPTITYSKAPGGVFPMGTTKVKVTAIDDAGNVSSCVFQVQVKDTTPPALTCPMDVTTEANTAGGATVNYPPATATDAVTADPTITYSQASGSVFAVGISTVRVTAKDKAGNLSTCKFEVTVQDMTAPQITCPPNQTMQAMSNGGTFVNVAPATATDIVSPPTIAYDPPLTSAFPIGTTRITATAKNSAGLTATCGFNVTIVDTLAPSLLCPSGVTAEATSAAGATVTYPPVQASDPVTMPAITYSDPSGSTFPLGTTQVTATATDAMGNTNTCTFPVVVQDTTPPAITCPADVTAMVSSPSGTVVQYGPVTATDAVTAIPTISYSHAETDPFPLGPTVVTVTAADDAGNKASCSFTVTIVDSTTPQIACPSDVVSEATGPDGAVVTYPAPQVSDVATTTPEVESDHPSGSRFPLGVTKVKLTAIDPAGNVASCSFNVTVHDTTAPQLSCPADISVQATGTGGATVTYATPTAQDAVTAMPLVTANHPSGSVFPVGATKVQIAATDAAGNQGTCQFTVTVTSAKTTAKSGCTTAGPTTWALLAAMAVFWRRRRRV